MSYLNILICISLLYAGLAYAAPTTPASTNITLPSNKPQTNVKPTYSNQTFVEPGQIPAGYYCPPGSICSICPDGTFAVGSGQDKSDGFEFTYTYNYSKTVIAGSTTAIHGKEATKSYAVAPPQERVRCMKMDQNLGWVDSK